MSRRICTSWVRWFNEICLGAYAPEVVYCNGLFVMVTSPGGMGHYIFTSESPLGPFKRASENFGCKIDGDIFIDNDGKWYFYYADGQGILCRPMTSPTSVDTKGRYILTGMKIDEGSGTWTEGSMIVYHDGIYYMTFTGNHVRHTAYRIEYGISYDGPTKFTRDPSSQVFVSTTSAVAGIGHSSSVKGPDLDSYYIVYHTRGSNGKSRDLNIDRIIFNGEEMTVLGPTVAQAAVPSMPDIYALFDAIEDADKFTGTFTIEDGYLKLGSDAKVYAKDALARDTYTVEVSVKDIAKNASAGVIFGYKDNNNYGTALFDTKTEELVVTFVVNGKSSEYRKALVRSFDIPYDFNAIQTIQVEKTGNTFTFYVGDRELCKYESTLSGTKIGVMTKGGTASFGFVGATAATGGNSTKEYYKTIGSQTGYILSTHCREWDIETGIREDNKGVYLKAKKGETYNYSVHTEQAGKYSVAACYISKNGATLSIFVDGKYVKDIKLAPSEDIASAVTRGINVGYKTHVITFYVKEGDADIYYYNFRLTAAGADEISVDYEEKYDNKTKYSDSTYWEIKDGKLKTSAYCKRLYGSYMLGDYVISVEATSGVSDYKYGLLVRTTNPGEATFIKGTSNTAVDTNNDGAYKGSTWMQGYYVEFTDEAIVIHKMNYNRNFSSAKVYSIDYKLPAGTNVLSVRCVGATLTIYVNGIEVGEYVDPEPYLTGMAGLKCNSRRAVYFDNLNIIPIN